MGTKLLATLELTDRIRLQYGLLDTDTEEDKLITILFDDYAEGHVSAKDLNSFLKVVLNND